MVCEKFKVGFDLKSTLYVVWSFARWRSSELWFRNREKDM